MITTPGFVGFDDQQLPSKLVGESPSSGYSVENVLVHPGKTVQRGDTLCTLAYHSQLYIQGTAFESDLATLQRIARHDWTITAESHGLSAGHPEAKRQEGLHLLRVDNHVDDATQTVRFFIMLGNQVEQSHRDQVGRLFEHWRFRPGQRIHLRLPVEKWENQVTLPADAVAVDGPNAFVFAEHREEDSHDEGEDDTHEEDETHEEGPHHDVFIELEPVPVRLLHRDDAVVVLDLDDGFDMGNTIALNNAHKLHLAMKMQAGGGGHHHHHDH
jgi:hypothetical protein